MRPHFYYFKIIKNKTQNQNSIRNSRGPHSQSTYSRNGQHWGLWSHSAYGLGLLIAILLNKQPSEEALREELMVIMFRPSANQIHCFKIIVESSKLWLDHIFPLCFPIVSGFLINSFVHNRVLIPRPRPVPAHWDDEIRSLTPVLLWKANP